VDPRVELLSVIFRLAGNPEYNQGRVARYTQAVEQQFGKARGHPVVVLARKLRQERGVSYDACMSLAVHLKDISSLGLRVPLEPWPEGLDARWRKQDIEQFQERARAFVVETHFAEFLGKQSKLFQVAVARMKPLLQRAGFEWFEHFFGARPGARFQLLLGMLNGGACYGPHVRLKDGREEYDGILGVWSTDASGLPRFQADTVPRSESPHAPPRRCRILCLLEPLP